MVEGPLKEQEGQEDAQEDGVLSRFISRMKQKQPVDRGEGQQQVYPAKALHYGEPVFPYEEYGDQKYAVGQSKQEEEPFKNREDPSSFKSPLAIVSVDLLMAPASQRHVTQVDG